MEQDDLREIWQQIKNYSSDKKELRPRKVGINDLLRNGFGENNTFDAYVLRKQSQSKIVGYAQCIYRYSTWTGPFLSVEDLMIFTDEQSLELYFIKEFLQIGQTKRLSRVDFLIPRNQIESSRMVALGAQPLPQWYTVRYSIPSLQSLTSSSNLQVHEKYNIREATPMDMESVLFLIQRLAEYENEPDALEQSKEDLVKHFSKSFLCFVAETTTKQTIEPSTTDKDLKSSRMPRNPAIIGMSLYFTFFCKRIGRVLHLEDLFVLPQYRNQGLGTELMKVTAKVALSTNCVEMGLQVIDWNTRASDLYIKLGGELITDEVMTRIERNNFEKISVVLDND